VKDSPFELSELERSKIKNLELNSKAQERINKRDEEIKRSEEMLKNIEEELRQSKLKSQFSPAPRK